MCPEVQSVQILFPWACLLEDLWRYTFGASVLIVIFIISTSTDFDVQAADMGMAFGFLTRIPPRPLHMSPDSLQMDFTSSPTLASGSRLFLHDVFLIPLHGCSFMIPRHAAFS